MGPSPFLTRLAVRKLTTLRLPQRYVSDAVWWSRVCKYICSPMASNLLTALDPASAVFALGIAKTCLRLPPRHASAAGQMLKQ